MALRKGIDCSRRYITSKPIGNSNLENIKRHLFLQQNINHVNSCEKVDKFLDSYDTYLFDCDGVLWKNDHITPLPNVAESIKKLQKLDKNIIYVTNNSNVSRRDLADKFKKHGFESPLQNIFGNAYAAAVYLKDIATRKTITCVTCYKRRC